MERAAAPGLRGARLRRQQPWRGTDLGSVEYGGLSSQPYQQAQHPRARGEGSL